MVSILRNNISMPEDSKLIAGLLPKNRNELPQLPLPREFKDAKCDLQVRRNWYQRQLDFIS